MNAIPKSTTPSPHRIGGQQLTGVPVCPHCGVTAPMLSLVWHSGDPLPRADRLPESRWSAYRCTTCGHVVTAKGKSEERVANPVVDAVFPSIWSPDAALPERVAHYLNQARNTLANPDASVLMSAAAIDALLKDNQLRDGSLHKRIEEAVAKGLLTT